MDEQVLQRLGLEFAGHDDIQALITATRARAWEARVLETLEQEVAEAEAVLDGLQIPEGKLVELNWHRLSLAGRIQVLYERMLHHLRQVEAASEEQARTTLTPRLMVGQPVPIQASYAQVEASTMCSDELGEVHAVLDDYGVPRALFTVLGPDWRAHDVRASAAERLRKLHRLMVESGMPDFMPPGMVVEG